MDFISWLLALIGIGSDRAMHRSNRRAEVARLNAEVAGEIGRALDIIAMAMPRLIRRCHDVCPDNPEICESMVKILEEQRHYATEIAAMAENYKGQIINTKGIFDWNDAIVQHLEWRATVSRIPPYVQEIVSRYDTILYEAGAR